MPRGIIRRRLKALPSGSRLTLVDVGSMGGLEPEWSWLKDESLLKSFGFEPDEREFAKLSSDDRTVFHPCALSDKPGRAPELYVARELGKASLFKPNVELLRRFPTPERFETVRAINLPSDRVHTLDEIVPAADFIKLDTQGSELSILQGGENPEPATVRQILEHVGEPTSAPAIASARSPLLEMKIGQELIAPVAVFEAIPEVEFDQIANLAAVAVFLEVASLRAIVRAAARGS